MRLSCGLSPYEGKWGISLPEFPLAPSQNLPLILYYSALLWQLTESAFQTPRERTLELSHATPTQSQTAGEIASRLFCDNVVKKDRVSAWRAESGSNSQGGTPGIVLIPRRASLLPPTSRWERIFISEDSALQLSEVEAHTHALLQVYMHLVSSKKRKPVFRASAVF